MDGATFSMQSIGRDILVNSQENSLRFSSQFSSFLPREVRRRMRGIVQWYLATAGLRLQCPRDRGSQRARARYTVSRGMPASYPARRLQLAKA